MSETRIVEESRIVVKIYDHKKIQIFLLSHLKE